jgi:hypothetical protein
MIRLILVQRSGGTMSPEDCRKNRSPRRTNLASRDRAILQTYQRTPNRKLPASSRVSATRLNTLPSRTSRASGPSLRSMLRSLLPEPDICICCVNQARLQRVVVAQQPVAERDPAVDHAVRNRRYGATDEFRSSSDPYEPAALTSDLPPSCRARQSTRTAPVSSGHVR